MHVCVDCSYVFRCLDGSLQLARFLVEFAAFVYWMHTFEVYQIRFAKWFEPIALL
jgi:hypothetical protein